ncbi:hypothetical protein RJ639_017376 [Escallonia herrerae]|uniref:C-CAP/cofactor C-like domain-containing protein n=1 Tax=Escallonia herrerae TaxID=1293975 RepID=A0AA89AKM0_9ASTE|nr:hypothetical protein RJ639_017376 [Escallonia herrerae]
MEEQAPPPPLPTTTTTETLDAATQRKHAAMLDRLSTLQQSRLRSHKPNPTDTPPSFESNQSFLSRFSTTKLAIESDLALIRQSPSDPNPITDPKSQLQSLSLSIAGLEKFVAENSYFLPSYEVRTCLKSISDLKQTLDHVTSLVIPKKKFSFKSKPTKKGPIAPTSPTQTESRNTEPTKVGSFKVPDLPGFRSKENEVLTKVFKGGGLDEIGEFTVSDLVDCEVRLLGCLRALFVHRLRNCRVYVGPVFGSVLIEEVEGCVFVLASHQIRIHCATLSDFYLRVRSRPIIEDSCGVRFAPYCLRYDGVERDLEESNLNEETGNWANVDDFRWLKAVQSPNWAVLPESERISAVEILNPDT